MALYKEADDGHSRIAYYNRRAFVSQNCDGTLLLQSRHLGVAPSRFTSSFIALLYLCYLHYLINKKYYKLL